MQNTHFYTSTWNSIFLILSLCLITFGCNTHSREVNNITIEKSEFSISTKDQIVANLLMWQSMRINNHQYLAAYDHMLHKIAIFSLAKKELVTTIQLKKEGPKAVNLLGFKAINFNRILITNLHSMYEVDSNGDIINQLSFLNKTYPIKDYNPSDLIIHNGYPDSSYDSKNNRLMIFFRRNMAYLDEENKNPLLGAIDLNNDSLIYFDTAYPDFFYNGFNYRAKAFPGITFKDSAIVYNFPAMSEVFLFNERNHSTQKFKVSSDFTPNESPPAGKDINPLYNRQLFYSSLYYDSLNKRYYAVHFGLKDTDTQDHESQFPNTYLRIFNNDLQKLAEFDLGNDIKPKPCYVNNQILFRPRSPSHEEPIEFVRYTVK